ncbi:hypothetical protein EGW08_021480, partial [Elysia chlorotica]
TQNDLNTALLEACKEGRKFIVQRLVRSGADVNTRDNERCTTPLHVAAQQNFVDIADFLLDRHADINASDWQGNSALILAVHRSGSSDILNLLLSHGAKIDHKNSQSVTALMKAVEVMDIDAIKILMLSGSDVQHKNGSGLTARDIAAENGIADLAMVKFLVENGSCVNRMPPRDSPLVAAMYSDCIVDIPRFLLEHGANVNEVGDKEGNTPLHAALKSFFPPLPEENRMNTLMAFIKAGADPNKANCDGNTALHLAACSDDLLIVEQLIDAGAHLEARNSDGKTPMLLAAGKQQAGVILLLKKCGADMKAVDN